MRWPAKDPFRWKKSFAWLPVNIGGQTIWLEWIYRRFWGTHYQVRLIPEWPYCCDQMRGEMWIDGKIHSEWCPVHSPQSEGIAA